jgi:ABC-type nickel/cobalt efflux system permease component RcnA
VKRLALFLLLAYLGAVVFASAAAAHPLGNFTVNRYAAVHVSGQDVYVHYVLDLAEIPTVQDGARVRALGFAAQLARGLELQVDGRRAALRPLDRRVERRPGAGGLETLRFEAVFAADRTGARLALRDRNFASRLGWREVVVVADGGARLLRSSAPAESVSRALTAYPSDRLRSPLDVSAATASFRAGDGPGRAPELGSAPAAADHPSGFEALVEGDLSAGFVALSLVLALFWGAAHALGPGHGKAIVAGYLVGTRGRPRDAVVLGVVVTVTHTIGVFALGLVTLALSELFLPEQLYPWLNLVAGLLVVAVGVGVLRSRLRGWLHARAHAHGRPHGHDHAHDHHDHGHGHAHHHHHPEPGSRLRGLIGVGASAGIVPCPTALVVLLAAISLQRVGYGLLLIVAFSVGLAATVTGIGLLAVAARRAFARLSFDGPLVRLLPAASALVVLGLGLVMTARAIPQLS